MRLRPRLLPDSVGNLFTELGSDSVFPRPAVPGDIGSGNLFAEFGSDNVFPRPAVPGDLGSDSVLPCVAGSHAEPAGLTGFSE